jgi:hypothetical protein
MLNLVEHVANPIEILVKAREMLEPGGVIWLQTPNFRSLDAAIFRHRCWAGLHAPRHWVIFGPEGIRRALREAGLGAIEVERTQGGPFWSASLLGLRRSRRPVEPGASPLSDSPAYLPLAALGAGFDFATRWFRNTSQLVVLARADGAGSG